MLLVEQPEQLGPPAYFVVEAAAAAAQVKHPIQVPVPVVGELYLQEEGAEEAVQVGRVELVLPVHLKLVVKVD